MESENKSSGKNNVGFIDSDIKSLRENKCEFLKTEVVYLGHVLSEEGVKPDPRKLEAVREFPQPKVLKI